MVAAGLRVAARLARIGTVQVEGAWRPAETRSVAVTILPHLAAGGAAKSDGRRRYYRCWSVRASSAEILTTVPCRWSAGKLT